MDAHRTALSAAASLPLTTLSDRFAGDVITPTDDAYAEARRVWNGMVNEYPVAVAYCDNVGDVVAAVAFAREHDLTVAVRSGGHSVSGASVVSGGLVVDCSRLAWVRVDPESRTARVGAGADWGMVDRATQSFGLATPGGVVSDTGVAGLTLGGGTGYLSPKHGFAADNLRSIDVVTGRGERVTATSDRNADLLWAARGGGTVGVVTAFEFDLHPLDHDVVYAESWAPADRADDVLRAYRAYQETAPDEACVSPYFAYVPPTPEFPGDRHGELAVVLAGAYTGESAAGRDEFWGFIGGDDAFVTTNDTMAYVDLQSMLDDDFPTGRRYYWKSVPLAELTDATVRDLRSAAERAPSTLSTIVFWPMHGAVGRGGNDAGPVVGRDASVVVNVEAMWDDPVATAENVAWVRETCRQLRGETSLPGTLPNFAGGTDPDADDVYGERAARLQQVRREYDPGGIFAYERG